MHGLKVVSVITTERGAARPMSHPPLVHLFLILVLRKLQISWYKQAYSTCEKQMSMFSFILFYHIKHHKPDSNNAMT